MSPQSDAELLAEAMIADEWAEDRRRAWRDSWPYWFSQLSLVVGCVILPQWWLRLTFAVILVAYATIATFYMQLWWRKAERYLKGWIEEIRDRSD